MANLNWKRLNNVQLGRFAEYYAKMELASYGLDIYTSEVDDHGIDFVAKVDKERFVEFQVKSKLKTEYIFVTKRHFKIENDNLFLFLIIFETNQIPQCFIIPATAWKQTNDLLRYREYEDLKSEPEYGLNLSKKNMYLLEEYRIEKIMDEYFGIK
jgi:hypothetical protein